MSRFFRARSPDERSITRSVGRKAIIVACNTATIAAPAGTTDPTSGNNTATDTDIVTPVADLQITPVRVPHGKMDVFGYRIIVGTAADCYHALSVAHAVFKPLDGRFREKVEKSRKTYTRKVKHKKKEK